MCFYHTETVLTDKTPQYDPTPNTHYNYEENWTENRPSLKSWKELHRR